MKYHVSRHLVNRLSSLDNVMTPNAYFTEVYRNLTRKGILKKYDFSPKTREEHDLRIKIIREDKTLSAKEKIDLYKQEDLIFGQF